MDREGSNLLQGVGLMVPSRRYNHGAGGVVPGSRTVKQNYYSQSDVVAGYDDWRFRSAGGRYVDQCEQGRALFWLNFLQPHEKILDMPVGTGRLAHSLLQQGFTAVAGADFSPAMLEASAKRCGPQLTLSRQDAFATHFPDNTFAAVVSLRFTFHHEELLPLLQELTRITQPGGLVVFDTLRWTPRSWLGWLQKPFGGRIWSHNETQVHRVLAELGLTIDGMDRILLFPSFAYRFFPGPILRFVQTLERYLPSMLRSKAVWAVRKGAAFDHA